MSVGLVARNKGGQVILDMTASISQEVGFVVTNGANGSIAIPPPPAGKTSYFSVVSLVNMDGWRARLPGVVLSGTTLSWAYSYPTRGWGFFSANCRIHYGYY